MSFPDCSAKDIIMGFKMCSSLLGEEIRKDSEQKPEVGELKSHQGGSPSLSPVWCSADNRHFKPLQAERVKRHPSPSGISVSGWKPHKTGMKWVPPYPTMPGA